MAARKEPGNQWTNKEWRDAVRLSARRYHDEAAGLRKLQVMADNLVDSAVKGDLAALKEVGDRLDGKPAQALEHSGPEGSAIPIQMIELIAVKPDAAAD